MSLLRRIPGFAVLARMLILALGLGFAFEAAPLDAAQPAGCAAGDCMAEPFDEPREREGAAVAIVSVAVESAQSIDKAEESAVIAVLPPSLVLAPAFGEARELRHVRGPEVLPDKTGPPRA